MMKTLTEIAYEQGADIMEESGTVNVDSGEIIFENEAQLQATFDAMNAQNGEFVGYGVIDRDTIIQAECSEEACFNYVQFLRSSKAFNLDEMFIAKLYLAPKTLPPEWAEYVGRLEGALKEAGINIDKINNKR